MFLSSDKSDVKSDLFLEGFGPYKSKRAAYDAYFEFFRTRSFFSVIREKDGYYVLVRS